MGTRTRPVRISFRESRPGPCVKIIATCSLACDHHASVTGDEGGDDRVVVVMVVLVVVLLWGNYYPQPSTPLPCFIDVTIKPGGQMALKLHASGRGGFIARVDP